MSFTIVRQEDEEKKKFRQRMWNVAGLVALASLGFFLETYRQGCLGQVPAIIGRVFSVFGTAFSVIERTWAEGRSSAEGYDVV